MAYRCLKEALIKVFCEQLVIHLPLSQSVNADLPFFYFFSEVSTHVLSFYTKLGFFLSEISLTIRHSCPTVDNELTAA
jgi:hypothetical protein